MKSHTPIATLGRSFRYWRVPPILALAIFLFLPAGSGATTASSIKSPEDITAILQPFVDHHTIPGAVTLVATKDKILSVNAVGYSDLETKKPMAANTLFWIASQSKSMTAAALMMLVDEGKVNPEDPVEKYLPEFKDQMCAAAKGQDHAVAKKPSHPIKIREILSQVASSGRRHHSSDLHLGGKQPDGEQALIEGSDVSWHD